jgi:DNA-binding transcriptional MocR family regulator
VGEVGRGTFVRRRQEPEDFGWIEAAQTGGNESGVVDMSLACPWVPPDGEEGRLLGETLAEISRARGLDELMIYNPTTGLHRHRAVAAEWIRGMGHDVSPDQIIVTNGAQHAMTVSLAAFLRPGDTLLCAEVTYPGLKAVCQMLGIQLHGLPMDEEGILPGAIDTACQEIAARALYCVPTVQNPTSATMSVQRRRDVADMARKHGLVIVEDEIHVAKHAGRLPPLASFAPERTLHITTLCKWATFGLRIGFIAAPESAVDRLRSGVRSSLWMPAPLMTEVATRWISQGIADQLGHRKLAELTARHEIVEEVLGGRFTYHTDPRSLHLWVELPAPLRSDECVAQARQRGVWLAGAEAFAVGRDVPHAVRVSIASVPHREELRRGLNVLGDILDGSGEVCSDIL